MSARIVFFDGGDGSGKTTQIELLKESLSQLGYRVYATRLLGGTPIGEAIRAVMIDNTARPPETDMHMALAAYYAHLSEINSLTDADIVLIDRSPLSILAYQAYGSKLDFDLAKTQVDIFLSRLLPDLIIIYDADASVINERREHRNQHEGTDYFEAKDLVFHQAIAEGFREAAKQYKAKLIDATKPIDEVQKQTLALIEPLLKA